MVRASAPDATIATARPEWANARRIVVKIGSALLADRATGTLKAEWLASLLDDVAALARRPQAGRARVRRARSRSAGIRSKLPKGPLELEQSQAAAAVGQISLAHAYQELCRARGLDGGADPADARRHRGARGAISTRATRSRRCSALKAVPVVNENDTVATTEIRYGDNDRLSARVASHGVGRLPRAAVRRRRALHGAAERRRRRHAHSARHRHHAEIEAMAGDAGTELSKGGMKHQGRGRQDRARRRHGHGHHDGQGAAPPARDCAGCKVTWFLAKSDPVTARKRWISGQLEPSGHVYLDAGAERALLSGKSLLPAGVTRIDGSFDRGDAVAIKSADGRELGRGLVAYAADDARRIIGGKRSSEIADDPRL